MTAVDPHLRVTKTTCAYCGVGCGVLATPDGRGGASISGDPEHPANFGRLCSKGSALGETLGLENRLLHPMIRCDNGTMERVAWSDALDHVAHRFQHIIARDGPGAVAFYLSGQLLTEDYYVANKLMKGFVGSANVDTNSRLCMASSVAGHRRAFGADTVPGCYEDLDEADLLVLVGSNAAWCHPVLYQRMLVNKQSRGARIVVIDPRRTDTVGDDDLFLGLKPGTDTALFSGLLVHLADNGALDRDYIERHTTGFDDAMMRARSMAGSLGATALATGLSEPDVAAFFQMFANTPRVVTMYSQGVNQSAQGTDKVNAILNCHLATGRIGKLGASPFSLTGQPNAMGGREVGGLANQLAAHMGFSPPDIDRVRRFWKAPRIATHEGLKAVQMFEAIARGEIKALWVIGTNPAVSLPNADAVSAALKKLELFVVSENVVTNDTVDAGAQVLFPAQAWGEKSGTVTNSERRISRQRAFLSSPGEARPDWWIIGEIAKRLGFGAAFNFASAADIFREHAALSAFENEGNRDFDIGGLQALSDEAFDTMAPVQWPIRLDAQPQARFFAEGGFFTGEQKAGFIAPETPALRTETTAARPLRLNTGRVRDQWHTMTRTGMSPRLGQHLPEPFVEVHPDDAARHGVADGDFARVTTDYGQCTLRVVVSERQQRGMLFAPIHWSAVTATGARVGSLVAPLTDPFSGQPENKATPASITPYEYVFRGFALSRTPLELPAHAWWARVAVNGGYGYLLADNADLRGWQSWLGSIAGDDLAEYKDFGGGVYRAASFAADRIETCLFIGPARDAGDWNVVKGLFAADALSNDQRRMLLSGKSMDGLANAGPIICACFGVGRTTICDSIAAGARSAADIGAKLKAGTNCGSCIPELKRLIAQTAPNAVPQLAVAAN
ncbi:molybdopterin-dependent oxidoreductase [Bradyrhizobium sp. AUGA SZCCT0240]|uniref:nitrate reductase n=1 Tax=unclassified Bradyrhizobium TaxID=2631580 RepID=UPI001BA864C6|nr:MULTISPECIES: nitrate reductase [unclassified Bradyrhizobium]MBR1196685.1 molybdopterin-dependent oxidoreductase [Bradyrhizobium sp. AUGA SZCCT0158]MBR1241334.1 molybdopterin-dependent oxidoreductase [Bradyrhizobium sp. AUGA SZCCT0274]MBR1252784.1 molybdopterin-dependent oxidoreductase [Bradyrhizobium sp. AUGA SZCCT0240]